jgi:hypothetical protein
MHAGRKDLPSGDIHPGDSDTAQIFDPDGEKSQEPVLQPG